MEISAWILDVYPVESGMCVWALDANGNAHHWLDPWSPSFYIRAHPSSTSFLEKSLQALKTPFHIEIVEKRDFFSNEWFSVLNIHLRNPLLMTRFATGLANQPGLTLFNADMNLGQRYFYERGVFALAKCVFEVNEEGILRSIQLDDDPWKLDYASPPLRYAHLAFENQDATNAEDPRHSGNLLTKRVYVLTLGKDPQQGRSYVFDSTEDDLVDSLNRHMREWDPDILLTCWGDSVIMPRLEIHAQRTGKALQLSRDPKRTIKSAQNRNFFSYGKIIYQAGSRTLFGRLHIDLQNSFTVGHTGLDGLFEVARVAKIPLQRAARCTIGTSLSSMQHAWAIENNYLIPLDKGQTEDFRPAEDLIASDRGGLVYEPEIGWHEDLVEFDFSSMYPEIMIRNNVTPEAINCACCPDNKVPEINHHICRHRIGMVPSVLAPIVEKRRQYKQLIKQGHEKLACFKSRYDAFKWTLVTCFGYLGFRNARFGRIEAHECVNAYSREALLKAKETAEASGFHFVHAIIDSLWLKKPGASDEEVERLRVKIEKVTGLPLGLEGRYKWIRFMSSKLNPLVGVPNRYVGTFVTGATKVRGLELRRHDTPAFIVNLQEELIHVMSEASNVQELHALQSTLMQIIESCRERLRIGHMTPEELAIRINLTRQPSEYVNDTLSAIAAKKLEAAGVQLQAGEPIHYIVSAERDKIKDWRVTPLALIDGPFEYDVAYYNRLIDRAIEFTPLYPKKIETRPMQLTFGWE